MLLFESKDFKKTSEALKFKRNILDNPLELFETTSNVNPRGA